MGAKLLYLGPTTQITSDLELESTEQDLKIWQTPDGNHFITFYANARSSRKKRPKQYVRQSGKNRFSCRICAHD